MKLFLKIIGIIFLMILSAVAALGIGGYFTVREIDKILTTQLTTQVENANTIQDSNTISEDEKTNLQEAIDKAQEAIDDKGLNPFELVKENENLLNEIFKALTN